MSTQEVPSITEKAQLQSLPARRDGISRRRAKWSKDAPNDRLAVFALLPLRRVPAALRQAERVGAEVRWQRSMTLPPLR